MWLRFGCLVLRRIRASGEAKSLVLGGWPLSAVAGATGAGLLNAGYDALAYTYGLYKCGQ